MTFEYDFKQLPEKPGVYMMVDSRSSTPLKKWEYPAWIN